MQSTKNPELRFKKKGGEEYEDWEERQLNDFMSESFIKAEEQSLDKRITVRLNLQGVIARQKNNTDILGATTHYVRLAGQFIYGKQNLHKGAFGIIPKHLDGFQSSSDLPAFDINNKLNKDYLIYYLSRENLYKNLEDLSIGTGSKRIKPYLFLKIKIKLPSMEEQEKIAGCLSSLDKVIEKGEEETKNLKEYKKGLMQKLFSRELRFKKANGEEYADWEEKKLGEIFLESSKKGFEHKEILAATQDRGVIPYTMLEKNIFRDAKNLKSYKLVNKNDFVISLRSFEGGIEYSSYEGIISPAYVILTSKQKINYDFFKFYFKTYSFIHYVIRDGINASLRDGKSISFKEASLFSIQLPSLEEQEKIAGCLSSLDRVIEKGEEETKNLKEYKKGLMQKLFPKG